MTSVPEVPSEDRPPLVPLALPAEPGWASFLADRCDGQLHQARESLERLKTMPTEPALPVLEEWNRLTTAVANAAAVSSLIAQVHPAPQVRELAEGAERAVHKFSSELTLDRELFDVFAALPPTGDMQPSDEAQPFGAGRVSSGSSWQPSELDEQASRLLRLTRRDFRRAGVDRDEATRARLLELAERETALGQDFSRAVRDDVRTIRVPPQRLDGLPSDFVAAHPPEADGLVSISTDYPDSVPFRTFARDADARRELTVQFLNRGWPDNHSRLAELLAVRRERANLLGYESWADYDAEQKMIGSGTAIAQFIARIAVTAENAATAEHARLLARLRVDQPQASQIDSADTAYYTELVRRDKFGVDAQDVRSYFDFTRVRAGLLEVTGRLFGVRYEAIPDAPSWHPDVAVYDVHDARDAHDAGDAGDAGDVLSGGVGRRVGRIYLDLQPRTGKYKHAAQFDLMPGIAAQQLPEGVLVCNFSPGLMEHDDVVTLFHEFGHLLHHILGGEQQWQRFSGVATEWDFVEAPSQMLEEWAWNPDVLASFAVDAAGTPIPADLVARMRTADAFGQALWVRTQNFYSALSYTVHCGPVADLTELVRDLQAQYSLVAYLPDTHFAASFGHLVGYSSAYYTYLWSLVIAKDLLTAFSASDPFAPGPATRYRDTVLAAGGTRDAADLVEDFLGRPFRFDAFQAWLDDAARSSGEAIRPAS